MMLSSAGSGQTATDHMTDPRIMTFGEFRQMVFCLPARLPRGWQFDANGAWKKF